MFTKYFPNIPYVKETIVKAIVPLMMYPKMIFLVYFCLLEDLSFGIINKISRGKTFMDTNLIADGKIFVEEVATKKTIATSYKEFFKYIGNGAFYVTNPSKLHQYNLWL